MPAQRALQFGFAVVLGPTSVACESPNYAEPETWAAAELSESWVREDAGAAVEAGVSDTFATMSMNVRIPVDRGERSWTKRLPRISKVIERHAPDLIGLQEVQSEPFADLLSPAIREEAIRVDAGRQPPHPSYRGR